MKNDSVIDFLNKYNDFTKVITLGKTKLDSIASMYTIDHAINSLIKVVEEKRINEIDSSIINNLIHFTHVYFTIITIPQKETSKRKVLIRLVENLEKLENVLELEEKNIQR